MSITHFYSPLLSGPISIPVFFGWPRVSLSPRQRVNLLAEIVRPFPALEVRIVVFAPRRFLLIGFWTHCDQPQSPAAVHNRVREGVTYNLSD